MMNIVKLKRWFDEHALLWFDEHVFLRSAWRKLLALLVLVFLVTAMSFVGVGFVYGFRGKVLAEMLATQVGAIDLIPGTSAVFWERLLFHLFCVLAFGGLLVSVFCTAIQRHEERVLAGLVRYKGLKRHYVVIGWSSLAPELVSRLLAGEMDDWHPTGEGKPDWPMEKPRLLLCTATNVKSVRRELADRLGNKEFKRVVFYYGGLDFDRPEDTTATNGRQDKRQRIESVLDDLGISFARQVFLLSDRSDPWGRDVKILAFARMISDRLRCVTKESRQNCGVSQVLPVFAELDARGSQNVVPKFPSSPVGEPVVNSNYGIVYFRPFSVHELWATRLFSPDLPKGLRPLIYRELKQGDTIHLVVVGFTRMGAAITAQALRSCHIPVRNAEANESPIRTRVTVIDRQPQEAVFRSRYPHIDQIGDIELEFIVGDVADQGIRDIICASAVDSNCLLTVAVCLEDSDSSLAIALNLPEEVYLWGKPTCSTGDKTISAPSHRSAWKTEGNNVWVRQDFSSGFADALGSDDTRFAWVGAFGMASEVLTPRSFNEHGAMIRNHIYRKYQDELKKYRNEHQDAMPDKPLETVASVVKDCFSENGRSAFLKEACSRFLMPETTWSLRWANCHAGDSVAIFLSLLGYRAVPDGAREQGFIERLKNNVRLFPVRWDEFESAVGKRGFDKDAFADAEHRRWMADRTLAGLRQARSGEEKDPEFMIHNCFLPFNELTTQNNDRNSVLAIPLCLALEGYKIEPQE